MNPPVFLFITVSVSPLPSHSSWNVAAPNPSRVPRQSSENVFDSNPIRDIRDVCRAVVVRIVESI